MVVLFLNPLDTKAFNIDLIKEFYDSYNTFISPTYASQLSEGSLDQISV